MSSVLGLLLRTYSHLFELGLALFLIGLAIVAWASGPNNLALGMLPWEGAALRWIILILGTVGLASFRTAGRKQTAMDLSVMELVCTGCDGPRVLPVELFLRQRERIPTCLMAHHRRPDRLSGEPGSVGTQNGASMNFTYLVLF